MEKRLKKWLEESWSFPLIMAFCSLITGTFCYTVGLPSSAGPFYQEISLFFAISSGVLTIYFFLLAVKTKIAKTSKS